MVAMRAIVNMLGIVSTIILARLLTPGDFGIVALAGSAYAFFSLVGQFGFDSALIHHRNPSAEHYNSAWTANILVGVFVSLAMFFVAKPAAAFFSDPKIEHVVYAFSLLSFTKGFENIGVVNFRKSLKFRGDFLYFVIPKISSVLVAVTAAYFLRTYWALVMGMVTTQVATLIYSHASQPFRPRISLSKFRDLFEFSRWIIVSNFIRYLTVNGAEIAVGKLLHPAAVGIFGIARQIAFMPSKELLAPINRALFPGLAKVSDEPVRLKKILSRVIAATALISIPSAAGLSVLAQPLVDLFLGDKWIEAGPVLSIMGLVGLVMALRSTYGPTLLARGKPKALTIANALSVCVLLPSIIVLVPVLGVVSVAYAMLGSVLVSTPILVVAVRREIGFGWLDLGSSIWRPLLATVGMASVVIFARNYAISEYGVGMASVLGLILLGIVSYVACLAGSWAAAGFPDGAEREMISEIRSRVLSSKMRDTST